MDVAQPNDAWTAFVNDWRVRQVYMRSDEGIQFMDDHELDQSIIADILAVSVWEHTYKQKVSFTKDQLTTFVYIPQKKRVLNRLIGLGMVHNDGGELRIKKDHWNIAMDFCGTYYEIAWPMVVVDTKSKESFESEMDDMFASIVDVWTNTQKAAMPDVHSHKSVGNVRYVKFGGS